MITGYTIVALIHGLAALVLLSPLYFETRTYAWKPDPSTPNVTRCSRIAFYIAIPLFFFCLILDAICLARLHDNDIGPLAIWLAIEIYWLTGFGIVMFKKPKAIRRKEKENLPNQTSDATSEPAGAAPSSHQD